MGERRGRERLDLERHSDVCEGDPDRAFRVNALGTRYVAEGARRVGAWVCYLSTDYVFDGTKPEL